METVDVEQVVLVEVNDYLIFLIFHFVSIEHHLIHLISSQSMLQADHTTTVAESLQSLQQTTITTMLPHLSRILPPHPQHLWNPCQSPRSQQPPWNPSQ